MWRLRPAPRRKHAVRRSTSARVSSTTALSNAASSRTCRSARSSSSWPFAGRCEGGLVGAARGTEGRTGAGADGPEPSRSQRCSPDTSSDAAPHTVEQPENLPSHATPHSGHPHELIPASIPWSQPCSITTPNSSSVLDCRRRPSSDSADVRTCPRCACRVVESTQCTDALTSTSRQGESEADAECDQTQRRERGEVPRTGERQSIVATAGTRVGAGRCRGGHRGRRPRCGNLAFGRVDAEMVSGELSVEAAASTSLPATEPECPPFGVSQGIATVTEKLPSASTGTSLARVTGLECRTIVPTALQHEPEMVRVPPVGDVETLSAISGVVDCA